MSTHVMSVITILSVTQNTLLAHGSGKLTEVKEDKEEMAGMLNATCFPEWAKNMTTQESVIATKLISFFSARWDLFSNVKKNLLFHFLPQTH